MIERLKKRSDFLNVAKGKRWVTPNFTLQMRLHAESLDASTDGERAGLNMVNVAPPRLGYTVTKKAGNSVQRNRIRRRLKSAIDSLAFEFVGRNLAHAKFDYVLIGRDTILRIDFTVLINELRSAFEGVHRVRSSGRA